MIGVMYNEKVFVFKGVKYEQGANKQWGIFEKKS